VCVAAVAVVSEEVSPVEPESPEPTTVIDWSW
jgi:hypothetical protein